MQLKIKKLDASAKIPNYAKFGDAGMDFYSLKDYILQSGERILVSTGIAVEVPEGYEMQIRPRSGLALKNGISIVNSPGTIDAGYRGEIGVILINHGQEEFKINQHDKIAQGVLNKIEYAEIEEVTELSESERGVGGFGSSGR